jgi:hypothetical protein
MHARVGTSRFTGIPVVMRGSAAATVALVAFALAGCGGLDRNAKVANRMAEQDPSHHYTVSCEDTFSIDDPLACSWDNGERDGWVCVRFDSEDHVAKIEKAVVNGYCG